MVNFVRNCLGFRDMQQIGLPQSNLVDTAGKVSWWNWL